MSATTFDAGAAIPRALRQSKNWSLTIAIGWVALVVGAAALQPLLPLADSLEPGVGPPRAAPSLEHLFGTDSLGRDLLSRTVAGARVSLTVGVLATLLAGTVGATLGILAGYVRRALESVIMGAIDVLLAFPALILAISLTAFLGASLRNVVIAISILALPSFARIARSQTLSISEREFVYAARSIGATHGRIMVREIVPSVARVLVAYSLVLLAVAIIVEGALSFLGLGIPPPTATWGGLISGGLDQLTAAPHISLIPAGVMFLTVLSINIIADHLQSRLGGRRQ